MRQSLERYFGFERLNTNWRTESLAGLTTFITMAYIIFVNPSILSQTGMPLAAVTAATCLCAAFGSILMGAVANYPLALAPGMGLNAYFTYTVVMKMGISWEAALGAVLLSGLIFLALTFTGVRQKLLESIPHQLHAAVAGGIGLFIAFVGLRNANIIVPSPATTVTLGNMSSPETALALFGIMLIAVLQVLRVKASMLIGILGTLLLGIALHRVHWQPMPYSISAIRATAFHLDVRGALQHGALEIIFVFLFVDLFDNIGTLVAVAERAGLMSKDHTIPRLERIFFADASATVFGALSGTSTVTSYIESAAGVAEGGRTGVTAIVTGLLFLVAMFVAPLVGAIPTFATSPALIIVGGLMLAGVGTIEWHEPTIAIPAFLTLVTIPLTYSIADGLSFGLTSYAALQILTGRARKKDWMLYILATLFALRFVYVAKH
ncbi:AGZA family xanthine/uracil permease-like MFS transporter [Granulicella aggregans]|jgi:AGZA family xanthine/uracil permease-like MFS transporter|uniref:AGZA family xanthine/uracil permease-like MFS transporter n=1 Tax=Granulicella aggregans TaxID=474949 RepID=A0A7W7Z983_9BACT|nr:NCS2 family permease [Granulicella aggregans]MBB5055628.1 AGZA family xanthine/uracil permease-like MFS transporter [Granulicella aggregans]